MKNLILKLLVLALAMIAALVPVVDRTQAQGVPANPQSVGPAPQEKTMEQAGKNIQVLKALPESQLGTVMNYVAGSLGVRCNYCHVNKGGNNWVWESDEKPEKQTAREMMKMVLEINKTTFKGNTEVGCYTCHRGRTTPMGIPALPLPSPSPRSQAQPQPSPAAAGSQPAPTPAPTPAGPTADQILVKYVDAIGGQAAIDKMKTRIMKGTYTGVNGTPLAYEIQQQAPDKFYIKVDEGTVERGFDGKLGWEKGPRGLNDLTNPVLDNLKSIFLFFRNIKLREELEQVRLSGKDKIGERDVLVVSGRSADNKRERLFFDAETGLLLRRITYVRTILGVIPEQMDFEDYALVDGVKLPYTVRFSSVEPGLVSTRKYAEIKINVPVDESKFNRPAVRP